MAAGIFGILDKIQKRGFEVEALNYPMEVYLDETFCLEKWLLSHKADYYLVGLHWFVHARGAYEVINRIRNSNSEAIIIVGGITASLFHELLMRDFKSIDYIIDGDGEEPIPMLVEALESKKDIDNIANLVYRKENKIIKSERKYILNNFEGFEYSNYSFLKNKEHYAEFSYPGIILEEKSLWLVNGRGCIYNCIGCGAARRARLGETYYCKEALICRNVDDVIQDIYNLRSFELDYIKLTHDFSSMGEKYYEEFFSRYKALSIETKIYNEFWQIPSEDFINKCTENGLSGRLDCTITAFTGDESMRKKLGKVFTNTELIECLNLCLDAHFTVKLYFSRFLPDENAISLLQTFKLIQTILNLDKSTQLIQIFYEGYLADPCSIMLEDVMLEDNYDIYINWESKNNGKVFQKMVHSLDGKSQLIDKKIINLLK
ncbi:B12-binding domain-containing radical SAM protein [Anaerosporobacter sp.]